MSEITKFSDPDFIETLRNMYAKDSTNDELRVFITLCSRYNLDPMLNEISFIKHRSNAKPIMQTTRDGYLKIANRDPNFDGMNGDTIYEGDILTQKDDGSIVVTYGPNHLAFDKSKLTGAVCNVFRKDRSKSSTIVVSFKDYDKSSQGFNPWKTHPHAMILKVAEAMALKRAFAINGLLTKEEFDPQEQPKLAITENKEPVDVITQLVEELKNLEDYEEVREKILNDYNIPRLSRIPIEKVNEVAMTYLSKVVEEDKEEE